MKLICLFILLSPLNAFAISGQVEYFTGSASISHNKETTPVKKTGETLEEGDALLTGAASTALLALSDGSKIKLKENSQVTINSHEENTLLGLVTGALFAKVKHQEGKKKFYIKSESTVMGVRGTEFFVALGKKQEKSHDVWMCVQEGSVAVQSLTDKKTVLVKAGEGVIVPAGKGVTVPKSYPWTKNLNWNMDPKKDLVDQSSLDGAYKDLLNQDYD